MNTCTDIEPRLSAYVDSALTAEERAEVAGHLDQCAQCRGIVRDLERALASLPPGCRTVFVLHDVEGCEHREIASLLGISDGTSKSQLHKARMRLRRALGAPAPSRAPLGIRT